MGGYEQFAANLCDWYDRASDRFDAREAARERPKPPPPVPFATIAVIAWMRGVVDFPEIGAYRCPPP